MNDQDLHDSKMEKAKYQLQGSRSRLEDLLRDKSVSSQAQSQPESLDPIAAVLKNNPGLTRERVAEIAEKLGF